MQSFSRTIAYIAGALLLGWVLSQIFASLQVLTAPPWLAVALLHTLVALVILRQASPYPAPAQTRLRWQWVFGPAAFILFGSLLLALLSQRADAPGSWEGHQIWPWLGVILWVPVVEELVYRRGLGGLLRSRAGHWLGLYLTSLIFALAHGFSFDGPLLLPTPPLGPFLLALGCELIYWRCRSLWGPILFHSACNATPLIFQWLDPRWLDWLRMLYLEV